MERQRRILKGNFDPLVDLGGSTGTNVTLFDYYDGNSSHKRVLEYPIKSCRAQERGCWVKTDATHYTYKMPDNNNDIVFTLDLNKFRFDCDTDNEDCRLLTK